MTAILSQEAIARGRPVALAGAAGLAVAVVVSLLLPSWYSARLSVVSLKRSGPGNMPVELRELGLSLPGGAGNDVDRIAAVLASDSVADAAIAKFDLRSRYGEKYTELARQELWKHCDVRAVPRGELVTISCEDQDPETARALVAFMGDTGNSVFRRVNTGFALEEVRFLEAHLQEIRVEAKKAQDRLRAFEEQHRIVDIKAQAEAVVSAIASLRAQRVGKELELEYAKGYSSREESTSLQLRRALAVLEEKERALEQGPAPGKHGETQVSAQGDIFPPALAVPGLRAELTELQLDRKFWEESELFTMQRLETARANQARDVSAFQVLDAPTLPTYRSRPRRLFIIALGAVFGLLLGAAWVFGPRYVRSLMESEP